MMTAQKYDRARLVAELIRDEDERLRTYRCTAGKLSIGVGRNLDDCGITHAETAELGITVASCVAHGITQSQSRALLDHDIDRCEADLDRHLPWWRGLDPVRQRVLLNMCFNMGIGTLLTFTRTLADIHAGQYASATLDMQQSKWHAEVKARAMRLEAMMAFGHS